MSSFQTSTPVLCEHLFQDLLNGTHRQEHVYKVALYSKQARLGAGTLKYTSSGEISGPGYKASGESLSGRVAAARSLKFQDVKWVRASFTASQALIYNASLDGRAICVIDLGAERMVHEASFTLELSKAPLIELAA